MVSTVPCVRARWCVCLCAQRLLGLAKLAFFLEALSHAADSRAAGLLLSAVLVGAIVWTVLMSTRRGSEAVHGAQARAKKSVQRACVCVGG